DVETHTAPVCVQLVIQCRWVAAQHNLPFAGLEQRGKVAVLLVGHLDSVHFPTVLVACAVDVGRIAVDQPFAVIESRNRIERRLADNLHATYTVDNGGQVLNGCPPSVHVASHAAASTPGCVTPGLPLPAERLPPADEVLQRHVEVCGILW